MNEVAAADLCPRVAGQPGQCIEAAFLPRPGVSNTECYARPRFAEFRLPVPEVAAKLRFISPQGEFVRGMASSEPPTGPAKDACEKATDCGCLRWCGPAHDPDELPVGLLGGDISFPDRTRKGGEATHAAATSPPRTRRAWVAPHA